MGETPMVDAAMAREISQEVPAHVPPDLVISCDFHSASGFAIDPFATIKWQRTEAPRIFFTPEHYLSPGSWVVTKAEDIRFVLQTPELFSSRDQISFGALVGETWDLIPLEADPPSHAAYRALLNPLFAPKQIKKLETELATVAAALVEKVQPQGQAEFMKCFSQPFPVSVFLQILDFPREEMNTFLDWEHGLLKSFDLGTRKNSARKIVDYLRAVINARRKSPGEDLVSLATQFKIDDRPLSDDEIVGMCFLLFVAGMDTVTMSLGFHFHHLAADQDLQARLRADRDMIPVAVEEFLRLYSIIQVHRRVTKDTVIAGVALKAGDCVTIPTSNASRDRREFTDPDAFDIARGDNRHVAFSYGMHRCIGSHLARRELVTAMNTWFDRVPQFRLQAGKPYRTHGGGVLGVEELHLAWD
jgi:cytochrome P450